ISSALSGHGPIAGYGYLDLPIVIEDVRNVRELRSPIPFERGQHPSMVRGDKVASFPLVHDVPRLKTAFAIERDPFQAPEPGRAPVCRLAGRRSRARARPEPGRACP